MATLTDTIDETLTFDQPDNKAQLCWFMTEAVEIDQPDNIYYWRTTRAINDLLKATDATAIAWNLGTIVAERIGVSLAFLRIYDSASVSESFTVADAFDLYKYATRTIRDKFQFSELVALAQQFSIVQIQNMSFEADVAPYLHWRVADTLTIADAIRLQKFVDIIERFGMTDRVLMPFKAKASILDQITMLDSLRRFLNADINDTLAVVESLARKRQTLRTNAETVQISDPATRGFLLRIEAKDDIEIDHTEALKLTFGLSVAEALEIVSLYLDPDNLTTWAVNVTNGAVTEYTNFKFNSMVQMGRKYIAASDEGLFELDGDDDAGEDIIARMKSGSLQIGKSNYSSFKGIYLGVRGGGQLVLKLDTGDGKTYTYSVEARDMETTRVNTGKGLRARYFSYELISTGQDFDLDSIEFIPIVARRRV